MRLQKAMAAAGVCSRRKAEALIAAGRVRVNGNVVTTPGSTVTASDRIEVDGKPVMRQVNKEYWAFYKPRGVLSTVRDDRGRPTALDFYRGHERVYPVGRLDMDSDGLMLITNDGAFAERVQHPRYGKAKTYRVQTHRPLRREELLRLRRGVVIDGYQTRPVEIKGSSGRYEWTLYEGRNRQIRKMLALFGVRVVSLTRVAIGNLRLGSMRPGEMRPIDKEEL